MKRYSVKEAEEIAGISSRQIRRLIAEGKIPADKIGAQWTVDVHGLEAIRLRPSKGRPRKNSGKNQ